MNKPAFRNWQSVQQEVLRRIHAREWKPGDLIPNEAALAIEFGCARTTVNRALRSLADNGQLDRRRKAGTRIPISPVAKATLDIPIIRNEVEVRGQTYGYKLLERSTVQAPTAIVASMKTRPDDELLHLQAVHIADGRPYAFENRWINIRVVPSAASETFEGTSANEWLLQNAPYTSGDISFSARSAVRSVAEILGCDEGAALFVVDRLTWDNAAAVTSVQISYAPGHQMRTNL